MQFFEKIWKLRRIGDINPIATERRRNYLVPEPNLHNAKFFTENILAIEIRKT